MALSQRAQSETVAQPSPRTAACRGDTGTCRRGSCCCCNCLGPDQPHLLAAWHMVPRATDPGCVSTRSPSETGHPDVFCLRLPSLFGASCPGRRQHRGGRVSREFLDLRWVHGGAEAWGQGAGLLVLDSAEAGLRAGIVLVCPCVLPADGEWAPRAGGTCPQLLRESEALCFTGTGP